MPRDNLCLQHPAVQLGDKQTRWWATNCKERLAGRGRAAPFLLSHYLQVAMAGLIPFLSLTSTHTHPDTLMHARPRVGTHWRRKPRFDVNLKLFCRCGKETCLPPSHFALTFSRGYLLRGWRQWTICSWVDRLLVSGFLCFTLYNGTTCWIPTESFWLTNPSCFPSSVTAWLCVRTRVCVITRVIEQTNCTFFVRSSY